MIGKNKLFCARAIAAALLAVGTAAQADITDYMSVDTGANLYSATFTNLSTEVGSPSEGFATIESYAWSDGTHWYYSYKISNIYTNDVTSGGFGFDKCDPNSTDGIYNFSINIADAPGGIDDLDLTGRATSSGGGGAWGGTIGEEIDLITGSTYIDSAQWAIQLEGATGGAIAPTKWAQVPNGKNKGDYYIDDDGDASSMDNFGQYFQIVSAYSPGVVDGQILSGSQSIGDDVGIGDVLAPVIPEPATGIAFAFGALIIIKGRKFIG